MSTQRRYIDGFFYPANAFCLSNVALSIELPRKDTTFSDTFSLFQK